MTGEEPISLREYLEQAINGLRTEMQAVKDQADTTFEFTQRAIDKAEHEMRQKLAIMNEFRGALTDQAAGFSTREQYEENRARIEKLASIATVDRLETRVAMLEQFHNNMQGRMWAIPIVVGVVVFVITQALRLWGGP